jgi:uncharacterized protein involved in exopolysaccharide biosynthesis
MNNDDEINLVDYIKVIIKRKWVIIGITIGAMIIAGILSWTTPKTYEISAVLEIGEIGSFVPETPTQLQEKISQGSYDEVLKKRLKMESIPEIEATTPKDTDLLIIETNIKEPQKNKKVLEELANIIIEEHKVKLDEQKSFLEEEIKKEEAKITALERGKNLSELQYLYIQHLSRIDNLKNDLERATPTQLIKSPSETLSQRSILINVIIALVLGLFIGILVAFFQEFWEKNKEELRQ